MKSSSQKGRRIPKKISEAVMERDFFRCVWCATHLYEKHHIHQYSKGGDHSIDNLILLCPNCHTKIHEKDQTAISIEELLTRRSVQKKGDRVNGLFTIDIESDKEPVFEVGASIIHLCPILIAWKDQDLLYYSRSRSGELLLSYRFYDQSGNLVFWMHNNTYWQTTDFRHTVDTDYLRIESKINSQYLEIRKADNDHLIIYGHSYINGLPFIINSEVLSLGKFVSKGWTFTDNGIAILIR